MKILCSNCRRYRPVNDFVRAKRRGVVASVARKLRTWKTCNICCHLRTRAKYAKKMRRKTTVQTCAAVLANLDGYLCRSPRSSSDSDCKDSSGCFDSDSNMDCPVGTGDRLSTDVICDYCRSSFPRSSARACCWACDVLRLGGSTGDEGHADAEDYSPKEFWDMMHEA